MARCRGLSAPRAFEPMALPEGAEGRDAEGAIVEQSARSHGHIDRLEVENFKCALAVTRLPHRASFALCANLRASRHVVTLKQIV
jgi:hypothetical protein